jgi:DNA-binding LacI/PurR family transcriptional regulator
MAANLITLQDIADRARVGRTTVSLALRNHPKISAATRERIRGLAESMGYRPNPLVAAHMSQIRALHPKATGQCLAFVCNRSLAEAREDRKTPLLKYYLGAKARADELGFALEFFNLREPKMSDRRLSDILRARSIGGVIIAPLSEGGVDAGLGLDWGAFACAVIEHTLARPRLHTVCNDEYTTMASAISLLAERGYRRIGMAMASRADDHANHHWLAGYEVFQALSRPENRIPHCIARDWSGPALLGWYRRWQPDAIITIDDDAVRWLREAGERVPEDVGFASVYWKADRAHLSGFYQNHELMGGEAVNVVTAQLYRNERGVPSHPKVVLVESEWREGKTLRRAGQSVPTPALALIER